LTLLDEWRVRVSNLRSDATARKLPTLLIGRPVVTARWVRSTLKVSGPVAHKAISQLVDRGVLTQRGRGRWNRLFEAPEAMHILRERR
jgi:predicted HTH transcriptional regulator